MSLETQPLTPPEPQKPLVANWQIGVGVVVALLLIGVSIWGIIYLANNFAAQIEALRDMFLILLALTSCLSVIAVIIMLVMVVRLVNMLEFEIKPILEKTNETIGMVRGTTTFVSDNVVRPVASVRGRLAGVRRGLAVLFGDPNKNQPYMEEYNNEQ